MAMFTHVQITLNSWLGHEDFLTQVQNAWHLGAEWCSNISNLTKALKTWNRNTYGNIFQKKKCLLARLEQIDRQLLEGPNERLSALKAELWG